MGDARRAGRLCSRYSCSGSQEISRCCNGRRLQLESVRHLFAMGGGAGGDFLQALAGFCLAHSVTVTIQMALGGIRPLYMTRFAILLGLPARGETAQAFPPEWAGSVVKASSSVHSRRRHVLDCSRPPGVVAVSTVVVHPDGRRIIVLARDDLWVADPEHQTAALLVSAVNEI